MNDAARYDIGAAVACSDGDCGELQYVVIDPVARTVTHLVVEPKHARGEARLVPIELAEPTADEIRLRCTVAEFDALDAAEETHFVRGRDMLGYETGQAVAWPYYGLAGGMGPGGLGTGGIGMPGVGIGGIGMANAPQISIEDRVPAGEVEVRRGEHVHASDGDIGRVAGLVIDPGDHRVTHVLLDDGHLWGKRQITIPIGAVKDVTADGVRVDLTREQVRDLPPLDVTHHD